MVLEEKSTLPETGGHDLTRISAERLLLSTANGVWVFEISTGKMVPFEPLQDTEHVKSVYYNETTEQLIYTRGEISWWTNTYTSGIPTRSWSFLISNCTR